MKLDMSFFNFLSDLKENNYKEWFHTNKKRYVHDLKDPFAKFIDELLIKLDINNDSKGTVFRINRDIRFSKDKTPYKTHVGAILSEGGRRDKVEPGFYFEIQHSALTLGGGCYFLPKEDLISVRTHIIEHYTQFNKIINNKTFVNFFNKIKGKKNKRLNAPFKSKALEIPILYNKQFYFMTELPIDILLKDNAVDKVAEILNSAQDLIVFLQKALNK